MRALDDSLTVIDFETTGAIAGFEDEPWQLGMVRVERGVLVMETGVDQLLRVGDRPFHASAPGRHAQLRDALREAPTMVSLWPVYRTWWGRPLVAHNAATEKKWLAKTAPMHPAGPWIDTLKLSRRAFPGLSSYALGDILHSRGLTDQVCALSPGRTVHDALFDAVACGVLLLHILSLPEWTDLSAADLARV
ncbi:MAG: 3'-5' exonuclease [Kiritimatiellae bacterium]|nr:3'-5' exonuclease [Kiritimatiellia bacterium]